MTEHRQKRHLQAVIHPNGRFMTAWTQSEAEAGPQSPPSPSSASDPSPLSTWETQLLEHARTDAWSAILQAALASPPPGLSPSLGWLHLVGTAFLKAFSTCPNASVDRGGTLVPLSDDTGDALLAESPWMLGAEHLSPDWLLQAWNHLHGSLGSLLNAWSGSVADWLTSGDRPLTPVGRICFHLVENPGADVPFAFLATYLPESDLSGLAAGKLPRHLPLQLALKEYAGNHRKLLDLLTVVHRAAESSALIRDLLDSGDLFQPIGLSAQEAYTYLTEIPLYEQHGILCRMPEWWKHRTQKPTVQIRIGQNPVSRLDMHALLDFQASIEYNGEPLSEADVQALLAEAEGLRLIKGRWVAIRHDQLRKTLEAYHQAERLMRKGGIPFAEALRFQLAQETDLGVRGGNLPDDVDAGLPTSPGDAVSASADIRTEVTQGDWLGSLTARLRNPASLQTVDAGEDFHAVLRPYQQVGLNWLGSLQQLGFGACLADDMGLGKTVQVLALINGLSGRCRAEGRAFHVLLVLPASLIGNWVAEAARFTPSLSVKVLHGANVARTPHSGEDPQAVLTLTTYGMLSRLPQLAEQEWDLLVLDEAQAIKNPGTRQTHAAKAIPARARLALTGTPVENRLGDLWSLFDFLNKGMLGSPKEFSRFADQLAAHPAGYAPLKRMIAPFLLRRMKTDRSIIDDLPDKVEAKAYADLTERQAVLYGEVVETIRASLMGGVSGIDRKGLVLAAMMKFKQICNHPDQYLGQPTFRPQDSGKFTRLAEICDIVRERRERMLVFTQFREMTEPLARYLSGFFGEDGLILHGGVPAGKRKELVDRFQGEDWIPFMVLSVKAGGVGLNLTAANHVVHFDRWWNPAVENQATDRAFRIGQHRNVMVHKFVTSGTLEEKIDRMIEDKRKLAQDIVPDLEATWITEMDDRALLSLFALDRPSKTTA